MRRFSEIPNTPTPQTRNGDLKVGALVTIPNTGRAILKYVGPVEGKPGKFAGFELLGDSAVLGKNSGEVNGVEYFKTSQPGAGLFMSYDKLIQTLEGTYSPQNNFRLSLTGGAVRFNQTPSRNGAHSTQASAAKKHPVITRQNSTPPLSTVPGSSSKNNSAERELQRVMHSKIIIENERDNLLREVDDLKSQIQDANDRLDENGTLLRQLQRSFRDTQLQLETANERIAQSDNKLAKQRRVYEDQRKELLEVLDQVEAQVNDNEQLYIGELRKLQEELRQKQEIIDDLQAKFKTLQELYEKQKNDIERVEDKQLDNLQSEVQNLKLKNLTQVKAIEQLRDDVKDREARIESLSKESLGLKEAHITGKTKMDSKLEEQESIIEKYKADAGVKENEIADLREQVRQLQAKVEQSSRGISDPGAMAELKKQHDDTVAEMTIAINNLKEKLKLSTGEDRLQELEFKLENKENIISDLRSQLAEEQKRSESIGASDNDLEALKDEILLKSKTIEKLQTELTSMKRSVEDFNALQEKLSTMESQIKEHEAKINERDLLLDEHKKKLVIHTSASEDMTSILSVKEQDLSLAQKEIKDLTEKLEQIILEKKQWETVKASKRELEEAVTLKEKEIEILRSKMKEYEGTKDVRLSETDRAEPEKSSESPELEEKILEIEILKEEITALKSSETQREKQRLTEELATLRKQNRYTTNQELLEQIQLLQKEIASRPTVEELKQVRSELELVEQLRRVEAKAKDKEIYQLKEQAYGRFSESSSPVISKPVEPLALNTRAAHNSQADAARTSPILSPLSANRPPVISQVVDGALQVYIPESKRDPGNGRKLWCGLCERSGHDSIDCPYENDIF